MAIPESTNIYGNFVPQKSKREVEGKESLTVGFAYPINAEDNGGYFSKSTGLKLGKTMIRSFLRTSRGERFMRPDYGVDLKKFLMEPLDQATFSLVKDEIQVSIRKYLRPFKLSKLQIFETATANLYVKIFFKLKDVESDQFNLGVRI